MFDHTLKLCIAEIAKEYDLEPAVLLAVVDVESGGRISARVNGRSEPLIRFEGHYFYRLLPRSKRNVAVVKGLASPNAGEVRNPIRQAARWRLLKRAEEIDRNAALESCSWGCGQVMGAHWRWLEFASIDAFVSQVRQGPEGQVQLMMKYINQAGLTAKLQNYDWSGFARAYNGPNFHKNHYDTKLQDAYEDYSAGEGSILRQRARRNSLPFLKLGSVGHAVHELQHALSGKGFTVVVDGDFGPATERALKGFQAENGLAADGVFGAKTMEVIQRKTLNLASLKFEENNSFAKDAGLFKTIG